MTKTTVYIGHIVHTRSFDEFEVIPDGFVAVDSEGKIVAVGGNYKEWENCDCDAVEVRLTETQFLMPGLVDCHIHAPQFAQIGLGLDMPLLDWLNTYTFPLEAKFTDLKFAQLVYEKVVESTIKSGTTLASYFGSNDKESTVILAKEAMRQGQRALVGKVCSDCNSPNFYVEKTPESAQATREFVADIKSLNTPLVQPTITPRFALSCSKELLKDLGTIAREHDLHIQSHISESVPEIEFVKSIFSTSYANAYDQAGLLTKKTIMAHGVHLEDEEISLLKQRGTSVAHCPASNTMLSSGFCDVQRLVKAGVKVGLGTDVSGGNAISIQDALLRALDVSKHLLFLKTQDVKGSGRLQPSQPDYEVLKYKQAIYLATLGGAEALALDHVTGNFVVGKQFDALLIDVSDNAFIHRPLKVEELVEKFIYTCDDRNILSVYVAGRKIK